jgi:hypothetical protein
MHCSDDQDLNRQEPRHIYHIPGSRLPRGDSGLQPWQAKMVEISWGGRILRPTSVGAFQWLGQLPSLPRSTFSTQGPGLVECMANLGLLV